MEHADALVKAAQYAEQVKHRFRPNAIVLFGSHANGDYTADSDIDVAVVFQGFQGDYLHTAAELWEMRRGISCDIEPHLLDSAEDQSGFARYIMNTGRVLYKAA